MSEKPDARTDTCEIRWRDGLPQPELFSRHFAELHVGAEVRGVEAVVDGMLEVRGTNYLLRVGGSDQIVELAPLTRKVQWNPQLKEALPPNSEELNAFRSLIDRRQHETNRVRVVGPLLAKDGASGVRLFLEVRKFEFTK